MNRQLRATVALAAVALFSATPVLGQAVMFYSAAQARERVTEALEVQRAGRFTEALQTLQLIQLSCGDAACKTEIELGLGQVNQRQASRDRLNADTLYLTAANHFQSVLRVQPGQRDALFGTAQVYRAMGPHEWQEGFFQRAPALDSTRRALYLSYAGDYYYSRTAWRQAVAQYRDALTADPDDPGARTGLIECLRAWGRSGLAELLSVGAEWERASPDLAARAYQYALSLALAAPLDTGSAEKALVGLVTVQARNGRSGGIVPEELAPGWAPVADLRTFLQSPAGPTPGWWRATESRAEAIALIGLARGRELVSRGDAAGAEGVWRSRLGAPTSRAQLDLRREMAMLYFAYPQLDPGGGKFNRIEQEIFLGKGIALTSGNLEAAQRFHTALGLIYAERSIWNGPYAHNARDQLTWAIDKARVRERSDKFYQPLPALEQKLAQGLDSIGQPVAARQHYLNAAAGWFDLDEFDNAAASLRHAIRLGVKWTAAEPAESVWTRRQRIAVTPEGGTLGALCAPGTAADWADGMRGSWSTPVADAGFVTRQAFKYDADCAHLLSGNTGIPFARAAFDRAYQGEVTLVGAGDVDRLKRVLGIVLSAKGGTARPARLVKSRLPSERGFRVWLPGETEEFWLVVNSQDLDRARGGMVAK